MELQTVGYDWKQHSMQVSLGCIYYCESLPGHTFATVDRKSLVAPRAVVLSLDCTSLPPRGLEAQSGLGGDLGSGVLVL